MKILELKENFTINQWLEIAGIREESKKMYLMGMQTFTEFTDMTPDELLNEADNEQDSNIKFRHRAVNKKLYSFRNYLQAKNLAPLSIKSYINGVKSFYRAFDIEFKPVQQEHAATLQENKKIPTIEDIRDILKICDPLERALILVGCSSGLDSATISNLKVADFENGYDASTGITTLVLRRLKTNVDFITFLTPEASEAVSVYLSYRARTVDTVGTKRLNQLAKQKVYAQSNYLFILRRIDDQFLTDHSEEWRKIDRAAFMKIYRDLSTKAKKNTEKGKFNFIRSHNFRKFFDSTLLNNGCDYFHVEEFMGHKLPGTQGHYYRPNAEELKKHYMRFVPYLTISPAADVINSPEYNKLKEDVTFYKELAGDYFAAALKLTHTQTELDKIQDEIMPKEQKEEVIKRWVLSRVPENEEEAQRFDELKKILKIG